ncbi:hypothetical protein HELRODRAFT_170248 [Helobdella robusta]|uniref:Peptidase S1 domain-containing protein n=1 Tax=Helobdella robusta TaxID=6412 RepID=T1F2U0_HELRO|nr:hypothetical protein HELRODRAFT_170248 [Helobdella robusta]ESO07710.1 hypothetical protein HELRODRAFT_170248 [Helobdella robusta]
MTSTAIGNKIMRKVISYNATTFDVDILEEENMKITNITFVRSCQNNLVITLQCLKEICGTRLLNSSRFQNNYIVHGKKVERGEFPWYARLTCETILCGASIIKQQWLVTAGHCIVQLDGPKNKFIVRFSPSQCSVSVGAVFKNDRNWNIYRIEKFIVHDKYSNKGNDIALIKLNRKLTFSAFVRPVCLPRQKYTVSDFPICVAIGLGKTIRGFLDV